MIRLGPFRPKLFITLSPPSLPPFVFTTLHSLLLSVFVSLSGSGIMSGPQADLASELFQQKKKAQMWVSPLDQRDTRLHGLL